MSVLRGKGRGLELMFADRAFDEALLELQACLGERAAFYNGSTATAVFGQQGPTEEELVQLRAVLEVAGITLAGVRTAILVEELSRRRANRPRREIELSDAARSLAADFAGARADLAARRTAAPIRQFTPPAPAAVPIAVPAASAAPSSVLEGAVVTTMYHVGTVRGGQSLHHVGNLVVVGDVNPGSELVASGDIVVFGSLRGVAHAGAQGDATARVYALELAATQLRIATFIAADEGAKKAGAAPEVACVLEGRITIVAHDQAQQITREGVH
ncbi:MAG: septum site-determining protein MinC [Candidatus Baltobacteraceae bacterium]